MLPLSHQFDGQHSKIHCKIITIYSSVKAMVPVNAGLKIEIFPSSLAKKTKIVD
jgi:hypothetical protein